MTAPALCRVPESSVKVSDRKMVAGLRRGDPATIRAFVARFSPVLLRIGRARHPDREAIAADTLTDVVLQFMDRRIEAPEDLTRYVVRAYINRESNARRRDQTTLRSLGLDAPLDAWEPHGVSAYTLRAARGLWDDEPEAESPRDVALASRLDALLTLPDRRVLDWVAAGVPQTQVAEWAGCTYGALRVRLNKIRNRLRDSLRRSL